MNIKINGMSEDIVQWASMATGVSFKARGLALYILALYNADEEISIKKICTESLEGSAAIQSGIKELQNCGFLQMIPRRIKGKVAGYTWTLGEGNK